MNPNEAHLALCFDAPDSSVIDALTADLNKCGRHLEKNLKEYGSALEHAFARIPSTCAYLAGMQTGKYVMKFGSSKWLPAALDKGEFLLSPASYYERREHDHARRDRELSRILAPNPRDSSVRAFLSNQPLTASNEKVVKTVELREKFDYYLFR